MHDVLIWNPESVQEILVNATRALGAAMQYSEARLQAELLLAHTLGTSRPMVLARLNETISPEVSAKYAASVARRAKLEPLAYIVGHQEFYGLDFIVDRRVLIPRHETELLVQLVLEHARHAPHTVPVVVDVGTGSGAIALTLAHHLATCRIYATDISPDALAVAAVNAERLNLQDRVTFLYGDNLARLEEHFDILVANLPYIPSRRYNELPVEVRRFEPRIALDGGDDGLDAIRRLVAQLPSRAGRDSVVFLEISEEQGKAALDLLQQLVPFAATTLHRDLEGMDRALEIRLNAGPGVILPRV